MHSKSFRQQELSKIFQEQSATYLEKWIQINKDDEKFTKRIFVTIRDMNTVVKNCIIIPDSTLTRHYTKKVAERAPRFDRIIAEVS